MFVGMTDDKILNEVAFARCNLNLSKFVPSRNPLKSSNEWRNYCSEGFEISMYIDPSYPFGVNPTDFPLTNTNYRSSFPKL